MVSVVWYSAIISGFAFILESDGACPLLFCVTGCHCACPGSGGTYLDLSPPVGGVGHVHLTFYHLDLNP
eukprot:g49373.t1